MTRKSDWRLVLLAGVELALVRASLLAVGYRTSARLAAALTPSPEWFLEDQPDPKQVAVAVETAASQSPIGTTCLVEALACKAMLDRCGFETDLRIGVAKADDSLQAHAWLVHQGDVLVGGGDDPTRYRVLADSLEL